MLEELLSRLAHDLGIDPEDIRLADYVDLIGGTGWGGYVVLVRASKQRLTIVDSSPLLSDTYV